MYTTFERLKKSQHLLLKFVEEPHEERLDSIIALLSPIKNEFPHFFKLFQSLRDKDADEFDIISQLDLLYEDLLAEAPAQSAPWGVPLSPDAIELLDDFIEEAQEQIQIFTAALEEAETIENNSNAINKAFRAIHTLKGSSGFLGLSDIITLTHEAENVLGDARKHAFIEPFHLKALLSVGDLLEDLLPAIQQKKLSPTLDLKPLLSAFTAPSPVSLPPKEPAKIEIFRPQAQTLSAQTLDMLDDFIDESQEQILSYTHLIESYEPAQNPDIQSAVFQCIHTLRTNAQALRLPTISQLTLAAENILKDPSALQDDEQRAALLSVSEAITRILDNLSQHQREGEESHEDITLRLERLQKESPHIRSQTLAPPTSNPHTTNHLRVPIGNLDHLMNLTSELVIIKNRIEKLLDHAPSEFKSLHTQLSLISRDLRDAVSKSRLQPVALIFRKVPKIVREASKIAGKQVDVLLEGEQVMLDKHLLDQLQEPLLHLVRNAIDHGIEATQSRLKNGKPIHGTLKITAQTLGALFQLTISDDGRGIDLERIKQRAIEDNLYTPDEYRHLSHQQRLHLIFKPGFSSKRTANELSGRGMGLDIVKAKIEHLSGDIHIHSQPDQGCSFVLQFPLSIQLMKALLIPVPSIPILIAQLRIKEIRQIQTRDIINIQEQHFVSFQEKLLPIISLRKILDIDIEAGSFLIICNQGQYLFGIQTPYIDGLHEVVSQHLPLFLQDIHIYQGMCLLDDGRPALILQLNHIYTFYDLMGFEIHEALTSPKYLSSYLLFEVLENEYLGCPLKQIGHILDLSEFTIHQCSGWDIIRYQDRDFSIIHPYQYLQHARSQPQTPAKYALLFFEPFPIALLILKPNGIIEGDFNLDKDLLRKGILGTLQYKQQPIEIIDISYFHHRFAKDHAKI